VATFRISQGHGKHRQDGRSYLPGEEVPLDRYDPCWGDKLEPAGAEADELRRVALTLRRKVWLRDLATARAKRIGWSAHRIGMRRWRTRRSLGSSGA
jgi:hypothetical protein